MKGMNLSMPKLLKENLNKIIGIFLLIQPILDLITGLCLHLLNINLTLGIIIRMIFLIFIIILAIKKNKKSLLYYIIFTIYLVIYLIVNLTFKNTSLIKELQGLLRTFYFPLLLLSLYELKDGIRISYATLFTTLFLYLLFIFIPLILGKGFATYNVAKLGTLGFYNSANEISGIISILTPIVFLILIKAKKLLPKILFTLLYLVIILTIGTKTPLLSLLITTILIFLYLIYIFIKTKKYKKLLLSFLIVISSLSLLVLVIPKTNFYKNIIIHLNYLEIDNITDVLKDEKLIDHFIFSERITFYSERKNTYIASNIYQKLFGIGYLTEKEEDKLIEMDYFDIYFNHGLIGLIIFLSVPLYILFKFSIQRRQYNIEMYILNISFLLIVFLSFQTGHILTSPSVSIIASLLILLLDCDKKKRLFFASYNLDLGGIETSLVNLLNNIDTNKYQVSLYLEERRGIFLDEVNKNIIIKELKVSNNQNTIIRKITNFSRKLLFTILNYKAYDFSCCYATYSLSSNKLSLLSSANNSIYIHSDYKYVYETEKEVREFFDNRNIESFKHIIFVSNESRKSFLELYPNLKEKCLVFNNFINIKKIRSLSLEKINYKKKDNTINFVFVGRLDDKSKKLGRALNVIKNIPSTNLLIVGDGVDRKKYEEEVKQLNIEDRVTFIGKKKNPYPYMKKADYIILTSDYEGFPVIYLEALALNKKVIGTINVSDDAINMEDYIYLVSKEEKKMLKEVQRILKANEKYKKIDLEIIQKNRMKQLEKIFDEV